MEKMFVLTVFLTRSVDIGKSMVFQAVSLGLVPLLLERILPAFRYTCQLRNCGVGEAMRDRR